MQIVRSRAGLAAGVLGVAVLAAPAAASAKVPVQLRIEGAKRTLFEGRVTVPVRAFRFTGSHARHRCDATAAVGGGEPAPVPTRGAAIAEASERFGFSLRGTWNGEFHSPSFTRIAGERVTFDPATQRFLAEYKDGEFASVGACLDRVRAGDEVLFAYATGSEQLLALRAAPRVATPQQPVVVRVTDEKSHAPVAGATVAGRLTGADGTAAVGPFARLGYHALKARKPGAIRSNRVRVCVTGGYDGACAPLGRITDIRYGARFRRRAAPRRLRGVIEAAPLGLKTVKLRLTRRAGGRWYVYSAARRRFVRRPAGTRRAFAIERRRDWSYRLPRRLGRGRYTLDVLATDLKGDRDRVRNGRSRVRFSVR